MGGCRCGEGFVEAEDGVGDGGCGVVRGEEAEGEGAGLALEVYEGVAEELFVGDGG